MAAAYAENMRLRASWYHLSILMICLGCTPRHEPAFYEAVYGTTRYIPMTTRLAGDYIDNDVRRVPTIINKCGGRFIAFNGKITDGAEAAYFVATDQSAVECVRRSLPQARVDTASAALVGKLRQRQNASANDD